MVDALRCLAREQAGRSAEPTAAATASQSVKTTESGGPAGYDAGKRVRGRKRNVTVDVTGCPLSLAVREASVQDRDGAPEVIRAMLGKAPKVSVLWADGGYRGGKLAGRLERTGFGKLLEIMGNRRTSKGSRCRPGAGWPGGRSPGCRGAGVCRRTPGAVWRAPLPGSGWQRAGS